MFNEIKRNIFQNMSSYSNYWKFGIRGNLYISYIWEELIMQIKIKHLINNYKD